MGCSRFFWSYHTPIACTGIELFGIESGLFVGLACFIAYLASGPIGIYHSQIVKAQASFVSKIKRGKLDNF
jgi:hypothetical protein